MVIDMKYVPMFFLGMVIVVMSMPLVAFGQSGYNVTLPQNAPARFTNTTLGGIEGWLVDILDFVFIVVGIISVGVILFAAILFMISGDDETRRGKAKSYLIWGAIGVAVAIISGSIIDIVDNILIGL